MIKVHSISALFRAIFTRLVPIQRKLDIGCVSFSSMNLHLTNLLLWYRWTQEYWKTNLWSVESKNYSVTLPYSHLITTAALFWPEQKLNQSFPFNFKNPFNMATLFIWPHICGPLVTGLTRFHCIYYIGIDLCFAGKYMYKACKFHTKLPPGRPK